MQPRADPVAGAAPGRAGSGTAFVEAERDAAGLDRAAPAARDASPLRSTSAPRPSGGARAATAGSHGARSAAGGSRAARARYRHILRFSARNLAVFWWFELLLPRIGLRRVADRSRTRRLQRFARRFHGLAIELGGLMIKVGQFMSSRLDVLPPEVTAELEGLQDEVPAVPFPEIRALAEQQLRAPLTPTFASFAPEAIAAASLGQAHRARLGGLDAEETGLDDVVVKVQRPGIDEIVDTDLAALRRVGGWLSRIRLVSSRVDMPALVEEFATTSLEEVDYLHEAANSVRFAESFDGDARVRVPAVAWELTTRKVLTLEDVSAIKISDLDGLRAAGIDPSDVARTFAAVMFDQIFTHGFFHADPHPGNIFVTPTPGASGEQPWTLTFVDFGMMGEVPPSTRSGLRKLLIAAATRNGRGLVDAMQELGVLLPTTGTAVLEQALTQLFARFGGMSAADLRDVDPKELRDFGDQFGRTLRSLPLQLPEHFLLIIRAVSLLSGVCSTLDPAFNLWDSVEPYADRLIREERGNVVQDLGRQALEAGRLALRLPGRLDGLVGRLEEGTLAVTVPTIDQRVTRLERSTTRLTSALVFGGLLTGGAVLHGSDVVLGTVLMVASALPLLHALLGGRGRR